MPEMQYGIPFGRKKQTKKNLHGKEGGKVNNNNKNNKIYYSN